MIRLNARLSSLNFGVYYMLMKKYFLSFCIVFFSFNCLIACVEEVANLSGNWKIVNGFMVYVFDEEDNYKILGTDASGQYSFISGEGSIQSGEESIKIFIKNGFLFIANDDKESAPWVDYFMLEPVTSSEAQALEAYMHPINKEVEDAFERMRSKRLQAEN